jgi:Ca2+-binding EF-hand superfamily protein
MRNAGKQLTTQEIEAMIHEVDLAQDGQISFEEFKTLMTPPDAQGDVVPVN